MISLLFSVSSVSAGSLNYMASSSLASTGAFVQEPMQYTSLASVASTGAFTAPSSYAPMASAASTGAFTAPSFSSYAPMASAASTGAYTTLGSAASTGAFVSAAPSYSAYTTLESAASTGALTAPSFSSYAPMASAASTGAYTTMASAASTGAWAAPSYSAPLASAASTGAIAAPLMTSSYMSPMKEIGSHSNPYKVENLAGGKLIGQSTMKNMGVKQMMLGEQHVVNNDLKVLENHEGDKTIFTKRVIHHSPVLHKTIRTHEIAEDVVHDKLVHHMNTVKDQYRKVPGNNYVGAEQHVDKTTPIPAFPKLTCPQGSVSKFGLDGAPMVGSDGRVICETKHVVGNDLKVLENHETDKTIFTKKVVHHSPVLHKTIRTHEIAEDVVHDKLVHHMNTVKDQFRKVPGNNYVGGEQHVDHTTAIAPAPQVVAQPVKTAPVMAKKWGSAKWGF